MMLLRYSCTALLTLALSTLTFAGEQEDYDAAHEMEGRVIIRQLQELITENTGYSREELKKRVPAFQEFYATQMVPRFKKLAVHISPGAMHWVDIDWDDEPEFIFWTEGLASTDVGLKEHLYIVKIDTNGEGYVMRSHRMQPQPSRDYGHYKYSRFWALPNKGRDTNPEIRALLTYGSFGESNVAYTNLEIRWDPKQDKVLVNEFRSYFPVAVEGRQANIH